MQKCRFEDLNGRIQKCVLNIVSLRTAFFWDIIQKVVVIPSQHFGTANPSHLPGLGPDRLSRNVGKELPLLAA
jgi:hypothetical protein